jgi:hypothetical protein
MPFEKMPEVRLKQDKPLRNSSFFKFIFMNDLLGNLAINQCDPYMYSHYSGDYG